MEVFKALKSLINSTIQLQHKSSGFKLTLQTLSPEGYAALENVGKYNPLSDDKPTSIKIEVEKDIIYLAYGIKEFENNLDFAKRFYEEDDFAEDTFYLIEGIRSLNPDVTKRHEEVILTIAFNQSEFRMFTVAKSNGLLKDVLVEITGETETIKALSKGVEILEAFDFFEQQAKVLNLTPEYIAAAEAKIILLNRGVGEEHLQHLPDYPKEVRKPDNIYVKET